MKKVILFDGECALCSSWIRFVFKNLSEIDKSILFLPSNTDLGISFLSDLDFKSIQSIHLVYENIFLSKSDAVLEILQYLKFPYPTVSKVLMILPKGLRDFFYEVVAKNRISWFGKKEYCPYNSLMSSISYGPNGNIDKEELSLHLQKYMDFRNRNL